MFSRSLHLHRLWNIFLLCNFKFFVLLNFNIIVFNFNWLCWKAGMTVPKIVLKELFRLPLKLGKDFINILFICDLFSRSCWAMLNDWRSVCGICKPNFCTERLDNIYTVSRIHGHPSGHTTPIYYHAVFLAQNIHDTYENHSRIVVFLLSYFLLVRQLTIRYYCRK